MAAKKCHPLGIHQTLWLALGLTTMSIVLGASALYRYQLYRTCRAAERLSVRAIAETYAAQAAPLMLTGLRPRITSFVQDLAWHPDSSLVAILDTRGEVVAARGNTPLIERYRKLSDDNQPGAGSETWSIPGDPDRSVPELNLTAVPIRSNASEEYLGTLVYAARDPSASGVSADDAWRFFANLLLVAATGMALGVLWLKQKVLRPLAFLARQSKGGGAPALLTSLTDRPDEIGELARGLTDAHTDREEWRQRAARLERSVDDRVAAETQEIRRELRRAEKKVWTDPLTQLGNRRLLDDKFADIFRAQREANQDLSIVMIDIDHFKMLNDTLGHKAGDRLLAFSGELLRQCLREQDFAIRYGGDELLLILPSVGVNDARSVAERIIRMFGQQAKLLTVEPKPTMSAGVASIREHCPSSAEDLLQLADEALYQAKKAGKSQVCVGKVDRRPALTR